MQKMAGFSLLELLSVLAVSSILLFAVYTLFFHQQQRQYDHQHLLKADENFRLAFHLLKKQIQAAGEASCAPIDTPAIAGFSGQTLGWTPALPAQLTGKVAPNSDVIWIEKANYTRANLARGMKNENDVIEITQKQLFAQGDLILITDCVSADFFVAHEVSETTTGQRIYPQRLPRSYGIEAQIMRWQIDAFYLAPSATDASVLALYQKPLLPEHSAKELIAGVDTLKVQYAIPSDTPTFVSADAVKDWAQVKGVSVSLGVQNQPLIPFNIILFAGGF